MLEQAAELEILTLPNLRRPQQGNILAYITLSIRTRVFPAIAPNALLLTAGASQDERKRDLAFGAAVIQ
jgi:hypothetical protein